MSTVSRQQPGAGIRARLLNRGAYQWYLGTIFGLAYQAFELISLWTSVRSLELKVTGTIALAIFYLGYIALPPVIWPQSTRARIIAIGLYFVATFSLVPFVGDNLVWVWPLVIAMVAFSWIPFSVSLLFTGVIVAVQLAFAYLNHFGLSDGTIFSPFVTVTVMISLLSITRQIMVNRQLQDAQATIASLAAAEERARLARDLHDVLGHSLTVVAVKSELAGRLVERDPARAITEIGDIESLARTALADLRAAVSSYREMNLDSELTAARTALDAAGIRAHLPRDGSAVDEDLRPLFGWVLREGVTNVIRHSKASECWVELKPRSLSVRDDGLGAPASRKGNGLTGLTERALEAGAKLAAANGEAGGYVLSVAKKAR